MTMTKRSIAATGLIAMMLLTHGCGPASRSNGPSSALQGDEVAAKTEPEFKAPHGNLKDSVAASAGILLGSTSINIALGGSSLSLFMHVTNKWKLRNLSLFVLGQLSMLGHQLGHGEVPLELRAIGFRLADNTLSLVRTSANVSYYKLGVKIFYDELRQLHEYLRENSRGRAVDDIINRDGVWMDPDYAQYLNGFDMPRPEEKEKAEKRQEFRLKVQANREKVEQYLKVSELPAGLTEQELIEKFKITLPEIRNIYFSMGKSDAKDANQATPTIAPKEGK